AAARGDYEIFHDLAWRAVQKGPRNDTDLMNLLARAMALSGRYGDALVMLGRVADLGGSTDAVTSPDFALVRQLKEWPALEAKLAGRPAPEPAAPPAASGAPSPAVPAATCCRSRGPRSIRSPSRTTRCHAAFSWAIATPVASSSSTRCPTTWSITS